MDNKLLDILVCPLCKGNLYYDKKAAELICRVDRLAFPIRDDIPVMLQDEARELAADEEVPEGLIDMDFKVVIPARYSSVRLPGKPLRKIAGRPMIQHVYERARESGADEVVIATDDERISQTAKAFGAEVCMTAAHHRSGSDRIAEVVEQLQWAADTIVVNLQGDEPTMPASLIDQVAADMQSHEPAGVTTLSAPIESHEMLFDPHIVKVVTDIEGYALYFSRAPIPWHRDEFLEGRESLPSAVAFSRHIGLYAYRAGYLKQFVSWAHAPLEQAESLEQLRVLWHGGKIHISQAIEAAGHGVDTEDDLKRVDEVLSR